MNIKKICQSIVIVSLFSPSVLFAQECSDNYSSLVFQEKAGKIISQTRSDVKIYPASLVKLMTVYLAFEAIKKNKINTSQSLIASDRTESVSAVNRVNTLKLSGGDSLSVEEVIRGSIVKSFNETTIMLAEAISGSEWRFVKDMNRKARELGMYHTNFRNASGLHDDGQFTTNYDLARLVIALKADFPEYYPLFSLKEITINDKKYISHNHVLFDYDGAEGMKTGFTSKAGFNLIAVAKKKDDRVISILTSCASYQMRDQFTMELFDDAFEKIGDAETEGDNSEVYIARK